MSVNEDYFNSATIESMVASKRSEKWGDYPPDVIALWECETDFEIAPEILDALKEGIENPATFYMGHKKIREHKDRIAAKIELRAGNRGCARLAPGPARDAQASVLVGIY